MQHSVLDVAVSALADFIFGSELSSDVEETLNRYAPGRVYTTYKLNYGEECKIRETVAIAQVYEAEQGVRGEVTFPHAADPVTYKLLWGAGGWTFAY